MPGRRVGTVRQAGRALPAEPVQHRTQQPPADSPDNTAYPLQALLRDLQLPLQRPLRALRSRQARLGAAQRRAVALRARRRRAQRLGLRHRLRGLGSRAAMLAHDD